MFFLQPQSIQTIAQLINAQIIGDKSLILKGINEIHKVKGGDLSFVDHPKYYKKVLNSSASAVLINAKEVDNPLQKTLLISDDPFRDYNRLVQHFQPFQPLNTTISATAVIGKNTYIAPNVTIGHHVNIGDNCVIHPNVTIYSHTQIGDGVTIHAGTVIGADAFYFKRRPEGYDKMCSSGQVLIQNKVEIGAACTIDRGVSGQTIIGEGTKLDNQVHVGHGVVIGKHCLIAAQVGIAGKTIIEDHVQLWGQVGVNKSLTIGENAVVYAQSGVAKSIEGNQVYFGSPVRPARQAFRETAGLHQLPNLIKAVRHLEKKLPASPLPITRQNISSGTKWESVVGYSRTVRIGNQVYVAGTTAVNEQGEVVGKGDAYKQAQFILQKIAKALTQADASLENIVRTRMYVTNIDDWQAVTKAHGEVFGSIRPASTLVAISRLIEVDLLVEIEVEGVMNYEL